MQRAGRLREGRVLKQAGKVLSGYEASAVRALLHAACSSPTARQAKVACTALLLSCWRDPPAGSKTAVPADLPLLVNAIRAAVPELRSFEDYLPLDPRPIVRFRAQRGERTWDFRVHPGSLETPLDVFQQLANYADALDPSMQRSIGFGIGDMIDVVGAMLDREQLVLSPVWSGVIVSADSPPVVTEAEIDVAAGYLRDWSVGSLLPETLASDGHSMQQDRAVQVLTTAASELSFAPGPFSATLGPALIVDSPAGMVPVPAGLILEGLDPAVMRVLSALTRALQNHREHQAPGPIREDNEPDRRAGAEDPADRWRDRSWSDLEMACCGGAREHLSRNYGLRS